MLVNKHEIDYILYLNLQLELTELKTNSCKLDSRTQQFQFHIRRILFVMIVIQYKATPMNWQIICKIIVRVYLSHVMISLPLFNFLFIFTNHQNFEGIIFPTFMMIPNIVISDVNIKQKLFSFQQIQFWRESKFIIILNSKEDQNVMLLQH